MNNFNYPVFQDKIRKLYTAETNQWVCSVEYPNTQKLTLKKLTSSITVLSR